MPTTLCLALENLSRSRGSKGLLVATPRITEDEARRLWKGLRAVAAGTQVFGARILREAARRLGHAVPKTTARVPRATDRTDPVWYRTRARGGSDRLAILRGLKRLAVARLPLLEAHVGRREAALFRRPPRDPGFPGNASAPDFQRASKRWLALLTGKATWLALRLAEVAAKSTGDAAAAVETMRVCAAVASSPRLYDPFNTFAAFLEAFHELAKRTGALEALLAGTPSPFLRIALPHPPPGKWHSRRAMRILAR